MTLQTLADAILILAVVGWIGYRQMTWRVVDPSRMWRMPALFAVIGAGVIVTGNKGAALTSIDVASLVIELVVSVSVGALMGAIAHFRPIGAGALAAYQARERRSGAAVDTESRTGWVGLALWFVMIAVRVGLGVAAAHFGATAVASTGVILLVLAANRGARAAVFAYRLERAPHRIPA